MKKGYVMQKQKQNNTENRTLSTLGRAALLYSELGYAVFPLNPRSKAPATDHGFKDATRDQKQILEWWSRNPHYNIGLPTGRLNGIVVLDLDSLDAFADIEQEFGKLPETPHQITGRGLQFFFQCARGMRSRTGFRPLVDIKADDGYVVVAPSIHPTGKKYEWEAFYNIKETPLAPLPNFLSHLGKGSTEDYETWLTNWNEVLLGLGGGIGEGMRNDAIYRISKHLLRRYVDEAIVRHILLSLNQTRFNPPLPEEEVLLTLDSASKREKRRRQEKQEKGAA